MNHRDAEYQILAPRATQASVKVASSGTSQVSAKLSYGLHELVADADCHVRQGASGVTADATDGHFLPADVPKLISVSSDAEAYVAVIAGSVTLAINPLWR